MWGAPSPAGWRHSATTWSQRLGTSKPTCKPTWASARLDDPRPCAFATLCASIAEARYRQVAQDFTAIPDPVGYASCIIIIDPAWSWRRGDALHIAAIRRCLRYATL